MGRAKRWGTRAVLFSVAVWIAALSSAFWAGPVITDVQVSDVTDTTATVTWTTNEAADSRVDYGLTASLGDSVSDGAYVTTHSLTLTGLQGCRLHFFSVTSTGASGTTTDDNGGDHFTFRTLKREYLFGPDGAEGGINGWSTVTAAGSEFAIDSCESHSASNAWKAGAHDAPTCTASCLAGTDTKISRDFDPGASGHGYHLRWWDWVDSNESGSCQIMVGTTVLATYGNADRTWVLHDLDLASFTDLRTVTFAFSTGSGYSGEGWYVDDVEISRLVECDVNLGLNSWRFADSCSGAGNADDGVADPGEALAFSLIVRNDGTLDGHNVTGTVTSGSEGVTVTSGTVSFGTVAPPDSENFTYTRKNFTSSTPATVLLSRSPSCGDILNFNLHLQADEDRGDFPFSVRVGERSPTLTEDFATGDPPTGWTAQVETGGELDQTWTTLNPGGWEAPVGMTAPFEILDSDYFGEDNSGNPYHQNASLIPPEVDCSAATSVRLSLDMLYMSLEIGEDEASIWVSTDGGATWGSQAVQSWDYTVGVAPQDSDPGTAAHVEIDLSAVAAGVEHVKVKFNYQGTYGWFWMIDNVRIVLNTGTCGTVVCCGTPAGLSAPTATDVDGACADAGVRITWAQDPGTAWGDEGMSAYDRTYTVYRGGDLVEGGLAYGTTATVDTGGANNTAYEYSVKYINTCGEEASTSTVSGTDAYLPATPTITGDSTNTCPATTVALSTEGGMSSYQWRKDGSPVGTNSAGFTATESGTYTVSYTNGSGCSGTSAGHAVTIQTCSVTPAPDGRGGTTPARGVKSGSDITVTFDSTTCPAPSYNLYYGPLSSVSTYAWTDAVCGIASGSSWTPPPGNTFWIIVGDSGPMESSWGLKRIGGVESQRSTSASGLCGNSLIDTTSTCP